MKHNRSHTKVAAHVTADLECRLLMCAVNTRTYALRLYTGL